MSTSLTLLQAQHAALIDESQPSCQFWSSRLASVVLSSDRLFSVCSQLAQGCSHVGRARDVAPIGEIQLSCRSKNSRQVSCFAILDQHFSSPVSPCWGRRAWCRL